MLGIPDAGLGRKLSDKFRELLRLLAFNLEYFAGEKSLGLPPLSPLLIEQMDLDLGSGPIPLVIHGKNITIKGLETSAVKEAQ